jgi:ankyrin repeat protein
LIAVYKNSIDAARFLIDAGANVNAKDNIDDSPYLYSGAEGRLEILKLTVAAGADLKSTNRYGGTALTPATHHGYVDTVAFLLTTEIEIDQVNFLGWTALLEAIVLGDGGVKYQNIVKLLLDAGADKTITDNDDVSPFQHAKLRGHEGIVKLLE